MLLLHSNLKLVCGVKSERAHLKEVFLRNTVIPLIIDSIGQQHQSVT